MPLLKKNRVFKAPMLNSSTLSQNKSQQSQNTDKHNPPKAKKFKPPTIEGFSLPKVEHNISGTQTFFSEENRSSPVADFSELKKSPAKPDTFHRVPSEPLESACSALRRESKIRKPTSTKKTAKEVDKTGEILNEYSVPKSEESKTQIPSSCSYVPTPLSQPLKGIRHKERLEWLQKRRNVGLFVQCDNCEKWRYLPHVKDPLELPHKWFCSMNPDKAYNSCTVEQQYISPEQEEDFVWNTYNSGSVVWAKLEGFPWWPAMVDDCPDTEQYYWINNYSDIPVYYNVSFFDSGTVSRAWLKPEQITEFKGKENRHPLTLRDEDRFGFRFSVAKRQAVDALTYDIKKRLQKYSFIARWPKAINSPKRKSTKIHKKHTQSYTTREHTHLTRRDEDESTIVVGKKQIKDTQLSDSDILKTKYKFGPHSPRAVKSMDKTHSQFNASQKYIQLNEQSGKESNNQLVSTGISKKQKITAKRFFETVPLKKERKKQPQNQKKSSQKEKKCEQSRISPKTMADSQKSSSGVKKLTKKKAKELRRFSRNKSAEQIILETMEMFNINPSQKSKDCADLKTTEKPKDYPLESPDIFEPYGSQGFSSFPMEQPNSDLVDIESAIKISDDDTLDFDFFE